MLNDPGQLTVTLKGTRPGSSLADAVFHLLMHDMLAEFQHWASQQAEFQQILAEAELTADPVVWSDDIAIVWAVRDGRDLPGMMRSIISAWDAIFSKRGFALNMSRGKTSVVATFRGKHAPQLRRDFQLGEDPGDEFELRGEKTKLYYVSHYRHLGTQFTSSHGLDLELNARLGMAKAAFAELSRRVLCNRHLPPAVRIRLLQTFVLTKLYFGLGAWTTPTVRQLQRIRGAIQKFVRRILHLPVDGAIPTEMIVKYRLTGILEPRARLALDRLFYSHKLWMDGPGFLQHLLLKEDMMVSNSWVKGLKADLTWLFSLVDAPDPAWSAVDLTTLIDFWQQGGVGWRRLVRQAWRRYGVQEALMHEAHHLHRQVFATIENNGGSLTPLPEADPLNASASGVSSFDCKCGRAFTTAVGLATHQRKAHGKMSQERHLLQGDTCPACLTKFWSTARLQQHLAYISRRTGENLCFQQLQRQKYTTTYEPTRSHHLSSGLHRVESQTVMGPLHAPMGQLEIDLRRVNADLRAVAEELRCEVPRPPDPDAEPQLQTALNDITIAAYKRFVDASFDADTFEGLADEWFSHMATFDLTFHTWAERLFLHWGESQLSDLLATLEDGEAEGLIEKCFSDCAEHLPTFELQLRHGDLSQQKRRILERTQQHFPHRPVRKGTANVRERLDTALRVLTISLHKMSG